MAKDLRSFALGLILFIGLTVLYLAMTRQGHEQGPLPGWVADSILFLAPLLSGASCGLLAPKRPILTLLALGITAAACITGLDVAFAASGRPFGVRRISGIWWIAAASVLLIPLLILIGGILGIRLRNRFAF
jgi:hypothetical protein